MPEQLLLLLPGHLPEQQPVLQMFLPGHLLLLLPEKLLLSGLGLPPGYFLFPESLSLSENPLFPGS